MIIDSQLLFSNAQSLAITTSTPSTVIDLTGGVALNIGVGTRYGAEMGIGDGSVPKIAAIIGTALTTTNSATLNIQFQGSTDSSTWTTYIESGALAAALLTANTFIARWDWPIRQIGASLPRYVRMNFVPATGIFTTGTIFAGIVTDRWDWTTPLYPSGFAVGT